MRSRNHLDATRRKVEAAVLTSLDHAFEFTADTIGAEMSHLDIDPAVRARVPLPDMVHDRAADDISRRTLAPRIVFKHESLSLRVREIAAGSTQAFFQNRAGHARALAGKQSGWMELHHL